MNTASFSGDQNYCLHLFSSNRTRIVTIRHNTIRDLTAKVLTEVCKDVSVEPHLHPITGETLDEATAKRATKQDFTSLLEVFGFLARRHFSI